MHSNKKTLVIIVRSRTPVPFAGQSIQHFRHPVHSTHNLQNALHCLRTGATFVCPQVKYSTKRAKAADPAPAQSDSFDFFESVKGRSLWNGRLVGGTGVGWVSSPVHTPRPCPPTHPCVPESGMLRLYAVRLAWQAPSCDTFECRRSKPSAGNRSLRCLACCCRFQLRAHMRERTERL